MTTEKDMQAMIRQIKEEADWDMAAISSLTRQTVAIFQDWYMPTRQFNQAIDDVYTAAKISYTKKSAAGGATSAREGFYLIMNFCEKLKTLKLEWEKIQEIVSFLKEYNNK